MLKQWAQGSYLYTLPKSNSKQLYKNHNKIQALAFASCQAHNRSCKRFAFPQFHTWWCFSRERVSGHLLLPPFSLLRFPPCCRPDLAASTGCRTGLAAAGLLVLVLPVLTARCRPPPAGHSPGRRLPQPWPPFLSTGCLCWHRHHDALLALCHTAGCCTTSGQRLVASLFKGWGGWPSNGLPLPPSAGDRESSASKREKERIHACCLQKRERESTHAATTLLHAC